MTNSPVTCSLASAEDTAKLARTIAAALRPSDCLLLDGPIGAGKTHLARHLIQSLMPRVEDVPSPTFTLVQVYDVPGAEIWHSDLYRLTSLDEIEELGLTEAFETAICLVEWPDRLDVLTPKNALHLQFDLDRDDADKRRLTFTWSDPKWTPLMTRISDD